MEGYYEGLTELREVGSIGDANKLLKDGFQILRIADRTTTDLQTKSVITAPLYILGRKGTVKEQVITQKVTTEQKSPTLEKEQHKVPNVQWKLPDIDWRHKDGDDTFTWAFVGDREGNISEENKAFRDLLKAKGEIRDGEFTYKLSKDERLFNRIKHKDTG
ncbi:MAG: hypothetical protein JRN67_11610 [Nitrososphaerota archaeon]|nr:hypothetical protein [Nitrososphaerota archaeon]